MVVKGEVDFVIVIEVFYLYNDLVMFFCYYWNCSVIVNKDYFLLKKGIIDILDIVKYLLVIYVFGFIGWFELD